MGCALTARAAPTSGASRPGRRRASTYALRAVVEAGPQRSPAVSWTIYPFASGLLGMCGMGVVCLGQFGKRVGSAFRSYSRTRRRRHGHDVCLRLWWRRSLAAMSGHFPSEKVRTRERPPQPV